MEYGYIIKLSNKNLYKEIQIPYNYERMSVGMDMDCDVRLYKDVFFDKFRLDFSKEGGHWQIVCSDNGYIDEGNVIKSHAMASSSIPIERLRAVGTRIAVANGYSKVGSIDGLLKTGLVNVLVTDLPTAKNIVSL